MIIIILLCSSVDSRDWFNLSAVIGRQCTAILHGDIGFLLRCISQVPELIIINNEQPEQERKKD